MRIKNIYYEAIKYCSRIWDASSNIVYVPDGTIFVETANGDGTFSPYIMNDVCCKEYKKYLISINATLPNGVSPENIEFNLDEQKCRWSKPNDTQCSVSQTNDIKIVLNPVGNDGAFFSLTENDNCGLKIKFDYLFKINCDTLNQIIKNIEAVGLAPRNANLNPLREKEFELNSELLNINNEIENLSIQNSKLSYSIECDKFPINIDEDETTNTSEITQTQKIPFTNTGFGSLTNSTDLSNSNGKRPIYQTKSVTYGITEIGLSYWRNILGDIRYLDFIDGDKDSYTCADVIQIEGLNQEELLAFNPNLLFETTTPFGEKTKIINQISELSKKQAVIKNELILINEQISLINEVNVDKLCSTLLGQFKSITADVTLDVIDNNNNKTQFYLQNLFSSLSNSLPTSTLYQYLVNSGDNSGFLVCGEPNTNETWASGCTGLVYPEFTNGELLSNPLSEEINVGVCESIKDVLYDELFVESGFPNSEIGTFNQSLSPNVFNSNWLTFEKTFDASEVTGLTNNKIVLNIVIKSSCGNLCILVDQISLTKICSDTDRTNIFISQSPGFELTKIIDNKKSWEQANQFTDRDFYIGDFDDSNKIRITDYSVDEERLILNSKEIDLTMNMASAVENDVWCYLLDNNCLLTGATLCDPCFDVNTKNFQDDECFDFQDSISYDYMDTFDGYNNAHSLCCGDNKISFNEIITTDLSNVNTVENLKNVLISELIDVKNRQTISSYPTLKALYVRYLNSLDWCGNKSSEFTYYTMDQFTNLIGDYWVDLIEQVIPATTLWGNVKVYTNTIFDQQKFKYKKYTSLLCKNDFNGVNVPSPVSTCGCEEVEVITSIITSDNPNPSKINKCDKICIVQMNSGSEFIGKVITSSFYE